MFWEPGVPSQRRFVVSPDGSVLAYVHAPTGALHLRYASGFEAVVSGVHSRDFRFSPDGRRVAILSGDRPPGGEDLIDEPLRDRVEVLDVMTGDRRVLGEVPRSKWVEWVRDGIVVEHGATSVPDEALTFFALDGTPRVLVTDTQIHRFTAASRGSRVVWFAPHWMYRIDLDDPSGTIERVTGNTEAVNNAELSPDGSRLVWLTWRAVYTLDEGDVPRELEAGKAYHSLWFSRDGSTLLYASEDEVVWTGPDGRTLRYGGASAPILSARFRRDAPGVIVARRDAVVAWDPISATAIRLAVGDGEADIEAADVYRGSAVVLRSRDGEEDPLPATGPAPRS